MVKIYVFKKNSTSSSYLPYIYYWVGTFQIGKNLLWIDGLVLINCFVFLGLENLQMKWTYENVIMCHFWSTYSWIKPSMIENETN